MGARLGNYAVDVLTNGENDKCVNYKDGKYFTIPLSVAIQPKCIDIEGYYKLIKILT